MEFKNDQIVEFQGEYRFLSNFWPCEIRHDGLRYPSVEHAFVAAKTLDFEQRWIASQIISPGGAKQFGKELVLRPDWNQCRDTIMWELVLQKFTEHRDLRTKLLATGEAKLIEGNRWNDTYWGVCRGVGENRLGQILMHVRRTLQP